MKILKQNLKLRGKSDLVVNGNKHAKSGRIKRSSHGDDLASNIGKVWGLTLGIVASVATYYHLYVTKERFDSFSLADTLDLGRTLGGFTSNLCQNVHVYTSPSQTFDAYLLQHGAEFDRYTRNVFNVSGTFIIRNSESHSFYLLEGSDVNASVCVSNIPDSSPGVSLIAKVLVFKGKSAYDEWSLAKTHLSSAMQVHELTFNNTCDGSAPLRFSLEASDTDNYYFVVNASSAVYPPRYLPVHVFYQLSRVRYDLAPAELICEGKTSCLVPLNLATSEDIVLKFGENDINPYLLYSHCEKRVMYWLLMLLVLPASIAIVLSLCCCCTHDGSPKKKTSKTKNQDSNLDSSASKTDDLKTASGGGLSEFTTVDVHTSRLVANAHPSGYARY